MVSYQWLDDFMRIFIEFSSDCRREYILTDKYSQAIQEGETVQINIKHPVLSEQISACILRDKEEF